MPLRAMLWFRFGSWCHHKHIPFMTGFKKRILGNIEIGDDAVIGANAVVIHDFPAGERPLAFQQKSFVYMAKKLIPKMKKYHRTNSGSH